MVSPFMVMVAVMTPPKPWPWPVRVVSCAAEEDAATDDDEPQAVRPASITQARPRERIFFMVSASFV